jgi:hypothetical protein
MLDHSEFIESTIENAEILLAKDALILAAQSNDWDGISLLLAYVNKSVPNSGQIFATIDALKNVHYFYDSAEAYDASQTYLQDGAIMVITSESIVAICDTWPFAITKEHGKLHAVKDWTDSHFSKFKLSIDHAIKIAKDHGFEIVSFN